MILCSLKIPLENHISVPDGSFFNFILNDELVGIKVSTIQGKKIISYREDLEWLNTKLGLRAEIIAKKSKNEDVILNVYFDNGGIQGKGYLQPNKFTILDFYFEAENRDMVLDDGIHERIKDKVQTYLDYFISHYLEISCDNDIGNINLSDVPVITFYSSEKYIFTKKQLSGDFNFEKNVFNWYDTERTGHLKDDFPIDWCQFFQGRLESAVSVPIFNQLLIDAKRQSYFYNNQELALVLCESAFETFVSSSVLQCAAHAGVNEIEVGRGRSKGLKGVDELVENESISVLLDSLNSFIPENIKSTNEHREWHVYAYEPRNKIIHRGYSGVTKSEVNKAFNSVNAYMQLIKRNLRSG